MLSGLLGFVASACTVSAAPQAKHEAPPTSAIVSPVSQAAIDSLEAVAYEGVDARGIPHYAIDSLSADEAAILRRAYGIEDPRHLYVSDSTEEGLLKYDTQVKRCRSCLVNSYRVGYVSVRRPGESWEAVEARVRHARPAGFTGGPIPSATATADLDPEVRPGAEAMLRAARAHGFHVTVTATYRSPLREAFLMASGGGRTHTLTSNHSYGRALDVVIDDGNRAHPQTKRDWIAFRQWVSHDTTASGDHFRVLGAVDHTWDWPHVELPSSTLGFRTIEQAVARGRQCLAPGSNTPCNFAPHLPPAFAHPLVQ